LPQASALAGLRAALALQWRSAPAVVLAQIVVTIPAGAAPVASAWLLREILDSLVGQHAGHHAGHTGWLVLGLAAAIGAQGALPYLAHYVAAQSSRAVERRATKELFEAVGKMAGLRRLEDPVFLDKLNTAQQVSLSGPGLVFNSAIAAAQSALTLVGFLTSLVVLSPVMAGVLLVATIPWVFIEIGLARRNAAMFSGISHAQRRQHFYANLLSSYTAAKELRLFNLNAFFRSRMLDELGAIQQAAQRTDRRQAQAYVLLSALSAAIAAAGLWWAVSAATRGRLTVGDVALFLTAVGATGSALGQIVTNGGTGYQAALMFRSYVEVVGQEPDMAPSGDPVAVPALTDGIVFDDVWFRYGPELPWALRGVSFRIPRGQAIALVGRNGAGKSTLVKLMCRFYDPDRGRILWDGADLRDMEPADLRGRISAVFQDYMSYELSARENIAVGDLDRPAEDQPIAVAAQRAGIDGALSALPYGYDTLLTETYFDLADKQDLRTGVLLSGGQWQRIALARGFFRSDRDLVILDEPNSGLDAEAEHEIHSELRSHRGDRTAVLISHRLNAVRESDMIIVLVDGEIAEQGDHHTLMAEAGTYARLFSLQAQGFADEGGNVYTGDHQR
jgi:ATP-binding cassette subfamily B protein